MIDRFDHKVVPATFHDEAFDGPVGVLVLPGNYGLIVSDQALAAKGGVAILGGPHVVRSNGALPVSEADVVLGNMDGVTHKGKAGDTIAHFIIVEAGGRA